jgi:hypothetical protein
MDPFGNDEIARLLRLKRYEQPPPAYFENFLHEFRRRQRDELLRQSPWRIWFERAQGVALRCLVAHLPMARQANRGEFGKVFTRRGERLSCYDYQSKLH